MSLSTGSRIGIYEVVAPLGSGGMGDVFRARDTRLGRDVAIKSLPESFAGHAERLARFEREARLLASLNHPNIATIYGLEESSGAPYLVLELVEGESLAQRLARGPLPVREAIEVGTQIAAAIEAAHARDVVHRDLKPGNVMLSESRQVKVLDFGLAKGGAFESAASSPDLSVSPTMALGTTGVGVILGTAAYMSPEQARGRSVDRRADVWALGCVLYECLTGRAVFDGETVSDVIARILEREPDWNALPASTPARLRDLIRRCLTKDVEARPRDVGDLRRELGSIAGDLSGHSTTAPSGKSSLPSLAVLYFENLAKDPDSEYFCSGMTEDILTDLSKVRGLRVASRNAVERYRGTQPDLARLGADLHVETVLQGSVRRAGDRVRISVQLVNTSDGFQRWAERYDRTMDDVFAVQEEIAAAIAEALRVALSPTEAKAIAKDRPQDVGAYDLYLRGREQYNLYTEDSFRQALDLFRQATERDPNYALAWAGIGDCYGQMLQWGFTTDRDETTRAGLEAARHASKLDPRLPHAYKAEGLILRFSGDIDGSRAANVKAVEADPRFTPSLINLAIDAFGRADVADAERLMRRTLEIDPQERFSIFWLGMVTMMTRRDAEACEVFARLRATGGMAFRGTGWTLRALTRTLTGDLATAAFELDDARTTGVEAEHLRAFEIALEVARGREGDAKPRLEALRAERGDALFLEEAVALAMAAVRLGDSVAAGEMFQTPLMRDLAATMIRLIPALHPILDQSAFTPRRLDATLVWPLEAPMLEASVHRLFREVKIESGLPKASGIG